MTLYRRQLLLSAAALAAAPFVHAQDAPLVYEGMRFDRKIRVAGADLTLNGTGVRSVAWFKGYAAALYLSTRTSAPAQVVAMPGPKRLQLRMMYEVPAAEFVKAFKKGMQRNAAADDLPRLAERMQRFEAMINAIGTVRKGDIVDLDLDPARGMLFALNGKLRGDAVPGDDFYATLLLSFVGEKPYDDRLKAGLLGGNA